jgi:UDP-2,3-diacylglucosamine pyrophosphatase LpxH
VRNKRKNKRERFIISLHREPAPAHFDLAAYADSLILLHGDATLDAALNLAHNINTAAHQFASERQLLEASADDLRTRLAQIEEWLRTARKP